MRALIFLCFFGWGVAANGILDCRGCYTALEGTDGTASNNTVNATVPEKPTQPPVKWDGTWIAVDNNVGFPQKPDDQNDLKEAKVQNLSPDSPKTRRRRVPETGNWNPLTGAGFEKKEAQLNVTEPLEGSNSTTNSSAANSTAPSEATPRPTVQDLSPDSPKTRRRRVAETGNWNPLTGAGFEKKDAQLNVTAPLEGSNSTTNSSTVFSTAKPEHKTTPKPAQPPSFWHPLKSGNSPGFPPEEIDKPKEQK